MHDDQSPVDPQAPLDPQAIEAYLLGLLSDDEVASLDRVLRDDSAALEQLAEAMQLMSLVRQEFAGRQAYQATHQHEPLLEDFNAMLKDLGAREAAAQAQVVTISVEPMASAKDNPGSLSMHELGVVAGYVFRKVVTSKPFIVGTSAAAAAIILMATLFFVNWGGDTTDQFTQQPEETQAPAVVKTQAQAVATLTAATNAQWAEDALAPGSALSPGSSLHPNQRLTLTAGYATITTHDGAIAILQAPATIELLDNNALRLDAGKLVGICETESSKGFLVRTPQMDVVDLGTRFGVDVTRSGGTEVHVAQGEVVAKTKATVFAKSIRQHLTANQAIRSGAATNTITSIQPDLKQFPVALQTHRLFSTGFDLAEGEIDSKWRVIADAQGALGQSLPLIVMRGERPDNHFPAKSNNPALAQWLIEPNGYGLYRDHVRLRIDVTRLTIQSRVDVPISVDLNDAILSLKYAVSSIAEIRINGQPLESMPLEPNGWNGVPDFHRVERPIDATALRHGENVIEIDIDRSARSTQAPPSIYFHSEIRPSASEADSPPSP